MRPECEIAPEQWGRWAAAAASPGLDAALRWLYDDLAADVSARSPTCWISGRCCKFDTYGHRLYVTGLEIAWLVRQLEPAGRARLLAVDPPAMDGCPFQIDKLCGVHALRPLGCRVYYCDPSARDWQNPVYETFLARLRRLHEAHLVDYRYLEWRDGLRQARSIITP
jgi:Fe-S-cluster containining protein